MKPPHVYPPLFHLKPGGDRPVWAMPTDFSLFRIRFAEACLVRGMKPEAVYRSIGIGERRALDLESVGVLRALDLYHVCQIADRLDVSVDWLVGRSNVMEIPTRERQA